MSSNHSYADLYPSDIPVDGNIDIILNALPVFTFIEEKPIPFEHAFAPWLHCLHRQLVDHCPAYTECCTEMVRSHMIRAFLIKLCDYFALALQSDFSKQRPDWMLSWFLSSGKNGNETNQASSSPNVQYQRYVKGIVSDGWKSFFRRFPVTRELIRTLLTNRFNYYKTFLQHFASDCESVTQFLGSDEKTALLDRLEFDLSDPHQGGQTVIKVTLEGGKQVFYKPRSFEVDRAWQHALTWMGDKLNLTFRTPNALEGRDYCWVEPLENKSLNCPEEGSLYYRRAGAILGAVYVLAGTDFHQENIIACGSHPILIDVETLLRPLVRPFNYDIFDETQKKAMLALENDSVMRTFLLPMWTPMGNHLFQDYGGLTPADDLEFTVHTWLDVNTDRMQRTQKLSRNRQLPNIPHYKGKQILVTDHIEDLIDGFRSAGRVLMENREALSGASSPWNALKTCTFRVLPRNTQIYTNMSRRLASASLLKSPDTFNEELEKMSTAFRSEDIPATRRQELEKVARLERDALRQHDIPVIHAHPTDLAACVGKKNHLGRFFSD